MSTVTACPLCGDAKRMKRTRLLYGRHVCRRCALKFANRRQLAFVIDLTALYAVQFVAFLVAVVLTSDHLGQTSDASDAVDTFITFGFLGLFLLKDGFSGFSLGKRLMGVQAVDRETLAPLGFRASAARNLPTLLPLVPLVIAFQVINGYRLGDGWAKAKVIWCKYADNPIFTGKPLPDTSQFGPQHIDLPPVQDSTNPFQAPRT
jgi:uncharacterized RDD family membrane protein YckC